MREFVVFYNVVYFDVFFKITQPLLGLLQKNV